MESFAQILLGLATAGAAVLGVLALVDTARWAARRAASRQQHD